MAGQIGIERQSAGFVRAGDVSLHLEISVVAADGSLSFRQDGAAPGLDVFYAAGIVSRHRRTRHAGPADAGADDCVRGVDSGVSFCQSGYRHRCFRREILPENELGLGSAIHVNAYKLSGMVPGALSLVLADIMPWQTVFWITAGFMLPGLVCTLLVKEPVVYGSPPKSMREAVVAPFREFVTRAGWGNALWVLAFIFCTSSATVWRPRWRPSFIIDLGFTMTQIGPSFPKLPACGPAWWEALSAGFG